MAGLGLHLEAHWSQWGLEWRPAAVGSGEVEAEEFQETDGLPALLGSPGPLSPRGRRLGARSPSQAWGAQPSGSPAPCCSQGTMQDCLLLQSQLGNLRTPPMSQSFWSPPRLTPLLPPQPSHLISGSEMGHLEGLLIAAQLS